MSSLDFIVGREAYKGTRSFSLSLLLLKWKDEKEVEEGGIAKGCIAGWLLPTGGGKEGVA